jgi:hypothetical protein
VVKTLYFTGLFSKVVGRSKTNVSRLSGQLCLLICFQKLLVGQKPMFVQIKWTNLFTGLFSKVVGRSRTNVRPD